MYYQITNELDDKVVGKDYPQVDCLTMAQAHLINSWHLFDPQPELKFELKKKAVLTDVLKDATISSRGFLISQKIKDLLADFKLMRHQFFNATVKAKKVKLDYYWLHLSEPQLSRYLDYKKSVFYRTEYTFREDLIDLKSYEHYEQLKKQDKDASFGVELDQIALSEEFDKALDMFTFLPFGLNIYISQKLRDALLEKNIMGFKIEEATHFV